MLFKEYLKEAAKTKKDLGMDEEEYKAAIEELDEYRKKESNRIKFKVLIKDEVKKGKLSYSVPVDDLLDHYLYDLKK